MNTQQYNNSKKSKESRYKKFLKPLMLCLLVLVPTSEAHEGPPFPIIVDREVGPYLVSVWTDPDIGIGTFFVVFEPKSENDDRKISSVRIGVTPSSGRLEEKVYKAEMQRTRTGARYYTEVEFDKGEKWKIRTIIEGEGWGDELHSEVIATPDGSVGPFTVIIYALPFLGIGILWVRAIMRRREIEQ